MDYAKESFQECVKLFKPTADMPVERLRKELSVFWDRMAAGVGGRIGDEALKDIYRTLLHRQRAAAAQTGWFAEPEVFLSAAPVSAKAPLVPTLALGLAAAADLVLGVLLAVNLKMTLAMGAGAALLLTLVPLALMGAGKGKSAPLNANVRTEARLNTAGIISSLESAARDLDADAASLLALTRVGAAGGTLDGLDLAREMLRFSCESGEALPARIASELDVYLIQNGIERVDYAPENAAMFTTLPANGEKTLMPALRKDGQLLSKGTACVSVKELEGK